MICSRHRCEVAPSSVCDGCVREHRYGLTHVRAEGSSTLCGLQNQSGTINFVHFASSFEKSPRGEAIAGQIERIPAPLCTDCRTKGLVAVVEMGLGR